MKKLHKRILGIGGLAFVAATTFVAAQMPAPDASAVSSTGMTDVLSVRVVGDKALVSITSPANKTVLTDPDQTIEMSYETASTVELTMSYKDSMSGTPTTAQLIWSAAPDYAAGTASQDVTLSNGYGLYTFNIIGKDFNNIPTAESATLVEYAPTKVTDINMDDQDYSITLDLEYDENEVEKVIIDVYVDGEKVDTIEVPSPQKQVTIPGNQVREWGDGEYEFAITTIGKDNDGDGEPDLDYVNQINPTYDVDGVPDTGSGNVNMNDLGDLVIDLDYDENEIEKVKVDIYVDGGRVETIWVDSPTKRVVVPVEQVREWGEGEYTFVFTYYGPNGEIRYTTTTIYDVTNIPSTGAPDTGGIGGLFRGANISQEDFMVTGLLAFFIIAVVAIGIIKSKRSAKASFKRK